MNGSLQAAPPSGKSDCGLVSASSAYLLIVPGGRNERWTGRHDEMIAEKWSDERRTGRGEQECGWEDK
ncbi:hypothetical protein SRHO_G00267740 [Serrasalmus rhombeus]